MNEADLRDIFERLVRIETKQEIVEELKEELMKIRDELSKPIKEQVSDVYKVAAVVAGLTSFFSGVIMWVLGRFI